MEASVEESRERANFGESDDVERDVVLAEPADARAEVGLVDERGGVLVGDVVGGAPRRGLAVERDDVDKGEARATNVDDPVMKQIAEFGRGEGHRQRGAAGERVQGIRGGGRRREGRGGRRVLAGGGYGDGGRVDAAVVDETIDRRRRRRGDGSNPVDAVVGSNAVPRRHQRDREERERARHADPRALPARHRAEAGRPAHVPDDRPTR